MRFLRNSLVHMREVETLFRSRSGGPMLVNALIAALSILILGALLTLR